MRTIESSIQISCIRWFRLQYPQYKDILIAVPNGGNRDAITGAILKKEGVKAGVADLLLLKPNKYYGHLAIEMKQPSGRQSDSQKAWQRATEAAGNKYVVCHSLDEFIEAVNGYLKEI